MKPLHVMSAPAPSLTEGCEKLHRDMLSAVAHDVKTPLASIIGSLDVLHVMQGKLNAEKQAELVRVALQEAYRLDSFITNMLDMAKLENGVYKPKKESVDIGTLLDSCAAHAARQPPIGSVEVHAAEGALKTTTDAALLSRVVELVLDNALKYGGSPPAVRAEYGRDNDVAYIRVIDNGDGIDEEQREAVFEKYVRISRTGGKGIAGAGLGLPIAREIMRLLNGTLTATGNPGGGTVFTLRFPL
jgi:two-component system sensor histidine kinase KdpD